MTVGPEGYQPLVWRNFADPNDDPGRLYSTPGMLSTCKHPITVEDGSMYYCLLPVGHKGFHSTRIGGCDFSYGGSREEILEREGHKDDSGKELQPELISHYFIEELSRVLRFGAKKYAVDNWKKGFTWRRAFGAALRHMYAWFRGETFDPETGLHHLSHAACNLMFLMDFQRLGLGTDDRDLRGPARMEEEGNEGGVNPTDS